VSVALTKSGFLKGFVIALVDGEIVNVRSGGEKVVGVWGVLEVELVVVGAAVFCEVVALHEEGRASAGEGDDELGVGVVETQGGIVNDNEVGFEIEERLGGNGAVFLVIELGEVEVVTGVGSGRVCSAGGYGDVVAELGEGGDLAGDDLSDSSGAEMVVDDEDVHVWGDRSGGSSPAQSRW